MTNSELTWSDFLSHEEYIDARCEYGRPEYDEEEEDDELLGC